MRTICIYVEYIKVITDYKDIKPSVTISFINYYLRNNWIDSYNQTCIGKYLSNHL